MIISLNWLKKYAEVTLPIDELATLIGSRLVEVEQVIDLGKKYQGIIIADVKHVEKHPNADKLNVVHIDDGGANKDVARLSSGLIEVVCGAPNVRVGIKVAWLPPGATVPSSYDKDPFVLEARELRGITSNGMLASAKELAIGEDHDGIVEVEKAVPAGSDFADVYELNDYLLDIENKSLTHRPDCFGLIGFAREVAAIADKQFTSPEWLLATDPILNDLGETKLEITATIEDSKACPRYEIVALAGANATKKSPPSIQSYLSRVGIRPISAIVDITNYLMYVTGQPLHAFDYDKVVAEHPDHTAEIIVRLSRDGEKLTLLDGRTITLSDNDIIICAGDKPIGLAGAMGGATTEIDDTTKNVLLESASFNLYNLRTTQMRHGVFSEAATRFTKGQAPIQTAPVLASAARMLIDITGATRASEVVDIYPQPQHIETVSLPVTIIKDTLGSLDPTRANVQNIVETLKHVEFGVKVDADDILHVAPPYWRRDIHIPEDVIEEFGRLYGYDAIPPLLPTRAMTAISPSQFDSFCFQFRDLLARAGANEVLTYTFAPEKLLRSANQDPSQAFKIVNAISPELQHYRLSLLPSLLEKVHPNIKQGYDEFALFELNKVHNKNDMLPDEDVPREPQHAALVYTADDKTAAQYTGAPYYSARTYLAYALDSLRLNWTIDSCDPEYAPSDIIDTQVVAPFEKKRLGLVRINGQLAGFVGELTAHTAKALKLPAFTAGFEIDLEILYEAYAARGKNYTPLSKYQGTERDICFRVATTVHYAQLVHLVRDQLAKTQLETTVQPVDIYQRDDDTQHKQITIRISMIDHKQTISSDEANRVVETITTAAAEQLSASII
ncbi:MAG TPA: phenylalanine--tRNA ligase subunit beta [Candidatus Saccharimonadales bacterium]|jgi:phenylalanyl-tRNA synthetase beta chain|nr:phenylalanine--tRNA ligase subunit beta [Candidatus Saccharimonadales bacterium]